MIAALIDTVIATLIDPRLQSGVVVKEKAVKDQVSRSLLSSGSSE